MLHCGCQLALEALSNNRFLYEKHVIGLILKTKWVIVSYHLGIYRRMPH
jgi:hypothetical protein